MTPANPPSPAASAVPTRAWVVTGMLSLFMVLNFMDKAVLGIVAEPLMKELDIAPAQFGLIASSFFLFFSLSAVGFGFVANRVSSKLLLLVCAAIWGISQFPLAFTVSVPLLYFSRIVLGAGEGPAYPLALHCCYKWFPNDRRNLPSAVIFQGVTVGLLVSGPLLTWVVARWSWHAAFFLLGMFSLVWMIVWFFVGKEGTVVDDGPSAAPSARPGESTSPSTRRLPYRFLLTDRTFLANMALYWAGYWIFSVMFTWVPSYLTRVMGYEKVTMGWMFMLFTAFGIPVVLGGSWLSERMLRRGATSRVARGWLSAGAALLGGVLMIMAIVFIESPLAKVVILAIGCNLPQLTFVLSSTIVAEISPTAQRSAMMSISSALATTGGLVAPALTGWLIQRQPDLALGYGQGFIVAGALIISVSLVALTLIRPEASKQRTAAFVAAGSQNRHPAVTLPASSRVAAR